MKFCWLLTIFLSDAISAHGHTRWFLINMFLHFGFIVGVSRRWCTGVVFMQPGAKVNGAYHYYCDVLLLKQLLPYICQAAGDFFAF